MKKIILLLFVFISTFSFSQTFKDSINSKKLLEIRELTISVPESFSRNPKKAYPLLVLLDGDYLFSAFDGALKYGNYWDDLPEMIIVGISQNKNSERFDDSTVNQESGLPEKKGEQFFEFISTELMPYIEKKYTIAPLKIIAGHDITAGFINFFLYKDRPLFNGFISISAEMPAHMEEYIPQRLAAFNNNIFYYHSSAGGDLKDMKDASKTLDENIKKTNNPKLNYKFDVFPDASHYSVVLFSVPNALYQFFDAFKPITSVEYKNKIANLPSGYVDYLKDKYDFIENSLGIKVPVRINDFRAIEAAINKNNAINDYEKLAQIANKNYPKTMLGEYYMAKYYEGNGDLKKATKSYQNAFGMEEIGDLTKDMMLDKADGLRSQIKK